MSILAADALVVENVSLHYGAAQALRGVSLQAPVGQVTAVMGRNGVGKTSLMRAITGREKVSAGRISLAGRDLTHLPPHARARAGVASCPQGREIRSEERRVGKEGRSRASADGENTERHTMVR